MLEIIALLSIIAALILLGFLCVIDLKVRLLPDELVLGFLCCGIIFHLATIFAYAEFTDIIIGALIGGGSLYTIRFIANKIYKQDTLGLGDVKLLTAAGVWLGPHYTLMAMTLGALAGIIHGAGYALHLKKKTGYMPPLNTLTLPAGPGFAVGILAAAVIAFHTLPELILRGL